MCILFAVLMRLCCYYLLAAIHLQHRCSTSLSVCESSHVFSLGYVFDFTSTIGPYNIA
uniref:Uncharacterized protein n=1 Tax=Anguilla anguilla TaxID=7936 RepID=A0A0E9QWG6_ANGAN